MLSFQEQLRDRNELGANKLATTRIDQAEAGFGGLDPKRINPGYAPMSANIPAVNSSGLQ